MNIFLELNEILQFFFIQNYFIFFFKHIDSEESLFYRIAHIAKLLNAIVEFIN